MPPTTTLPGANSHYISLGTAIDMTSHYRSNKETILATAYQNQNILPISETFNRAAIDSLLAVEGCAGIRLYYGMDTENNRIHAILVPVTEGNADILPSNTLLNEEDTPIVEIGQSCPPACPPASDLNP